MSDLEKEILKGIKNIDEILYWFNRIVNKDILDSPDMVWIMCNLLIDLGYRLDRLKLNIIKYNYQKNT